MMTVIQNEEGLSLIEVLGALAIFGLVATLLSSVLFSISKASTIQGQQVEYQQTANLMIAQIEKINRNSDIYTEANYFGKFNPNVNWKETHIIKLTDGDTSKAQTNAPSKDGLNPIFLTDINDNSNLKAESYQIKDRAVKIKVLLQKNEHEARKTSYGTSSYRDTFTIQTSGIILFYKGSINFTPFYDSDSGVWDMENLLTATSTKDKIQYSRKFVSSYRDDQKAKGDTPGNGRW